MRIPGAEQLVDLPLEVLLAPAADLDLDTVLRRSLASARSRSGTRGGALVVLDEHGEVDHVLLDGLTEQEARDLAAAEPREARAAGALVASIRDGETLFARLVLSGGDRPFTDEDEVAVGALARVAGVAVRNARAYALSERRREWVEATAELAEAFHPPVRLVELLTRIVAGARRIVRGSSAAVVGAGEHGFDVPAVDWDEPATLRDLLDEVGPQLRRARESGEPFEAAYGARGTVVGLPLSSVLTVAGVLLVRVDRGRGRLPAEDRELLTSFATQGSLALDRAVLLQARQHEVVAADRDRIAQELHDQVIQRLFATGMALRASSQAPNPPVTQHRIDETVRDLEQTIRDIRATIFELQHGREASLRESIAALAQEYAPALGFRPSIHTWGPVDSLVGHPVADHAPTVLREALANCARHAGASSCHVEVTVAEERFTLVVTDDGRGLDAEVHESGLRNLRRRAEDLGGSLDVRAALPRGTRVEWQVPLGGQ